MSKKLLSRRQSLGLKLMIRAWLLFLPLQTRRRIKTCHEGHTPTHLSVVPEVCERLNSGAWKVTVANSRLLRAQMGAHQQSCYANLLWQDVAMPLSAQRQCRIFRREATASSVLLKKYYFFYLRFELFFVFLKPFTRARISGEWSKTFMTFCLRGNAAFGLGLMNVFDPYPYLWHLTNLGTSDRICNAPTLLPHHLVEWNNEKWRRHRASPLLHRIPYAYGDRRKDDNMLIWGCLRRDHILFIEPIHVGPSTLLTLRGWG